MTAIIGTMAHLMAKAEYRSTGWSLEWLETPFVHSYMYTCMNILQFNQRTVNWDTKRRPTEGGSPLRMEPLTLKRAF